MRVLVCGDRKWTDPGPIKQKLVELGCPAYVTHLIEGEANGADKLSKQVALELGLPEDRILRYPADWDKHGRAAGPIRNREMLKLGNPHVVLAFHERPWDSKGTVDMVEIARARHLPVWCSWELGQSLDRWLWGSPVITDERCQVCRVRMNFWDDAGELTCPLCSWRMPSWMRKDQFD